MSVLGDGVIESYVSARPGSYYTPLGMLLVQSDITWLGHSVMSLLSRVPTVIVFVSSLGKMAICLMRVSWFHLR